MATSSSVTVKTLSIELKRFSDGLSKTAKELRAELAEMTEAQKELKEELESTANGFVEQSLTEIQGDDFDTIATIAQGIEELGSQGLAFYRDKLVSARNSALQSANESLGKTVDASSYQAALLEARQTCQQTLQTSMDKKSTLDGAKASLQDWEDTTVEDDFVRLDDAIAEKGGLPLTTDNKDYYEPNLFVSTWRYATSSTYRGVRHALAEYGHGREGRDAFAEVSNFRDKYEELLNAVTEAQDTYDAALAEQSAAETVSSNLIRYEADIKTDDQILDLVQAKLADDLEDCPEFIEAMAEHFEEDFPRNVPFLVAKLSTLGKLITGTKDKLADIQENYESVVEQYKKLQSMQSSLKVRNLDLKEMRSRHDAYTTEMDHYSRAARRSWERTREYDYDDYYRRRSTVRVDRSPSTIETILMYDMLSERRRDRYDRPLRSEELTKDSRYTADLLGVNKDKAREASLPEGVFDISPETSKQMSDLGIRDYKPGNLGKTFDIENASSRIRNRGDGVAFDIEAPKPKKSSSSRSFDIGSGSRSRSNTSLSSSFPSTGRKGGGGSSFSLGSSSKKSSSLSSGFGTSSRRGGGGSSFSLGSSKRKSGFSSSKRSSFASGSRSRSSRSFSSGRRGGGGKSFKL